MVVELERGKVNTWSIVRNVDVAVDAILCGNPYKVEQRTSIPHDDLALNQEVICFCRRDQGAAVDVYLCYFEHFLTA